MAAQAAAGSQDGWTDAYSVADGRNPWSIVAVISIATFMVVLDASIANVALAHIAGSLSVSYEESTWVVTSFLIANAVVIPISGWLADAIGRKRYYMISVAIFTGASIMCGLSQSLFMLLVWRIAQGIGGGGLAPVEQSMLVDTFPPAKRGAAFAAYGVVVVVGPILGPTLGGWLTDHLSWHWVFLINGPVGLLSLTLVSLYVAEPEAIRRRREQKRKNGLRIDFIGFTLVALGLGCLEFVLDRGEQADWFSSGMIVAFSVISGLAFLAFIPWELTRDDPVVRVSLYGKRNFAIANLLMLVMGAIIFSSTQFIPQLLQQVMGYTAEQAGMALTIGGLAAFVMMPVSGFLTSRVDVRYMVATGFIIQGLALWNMTTLNTHITFMDAAYARLWQSIGLPLLFIPITNAAYVGLAPEDSNQASALLNVTRNLGGSIGISLVQSMLINQGQIHQSRIVDTLQPLNPVYRQTLAHLTRQLAARGMSQLEAGKAAAAMLFHEMQHQVQMLAYLDVFRFLTILVFLSVPLAFLMKKPKKRGGAPTAH